MWGQVGRRRGARTPACRVETLQKPWLKSLIPKELLERGFCRQRRSQQGTLVAHLDTCSALDPVCEVMCADRLRDESSLDSGMTHRGAGSLWPATTAFERSCLSLVAG